jgi:hypothetical protein
VEVGLYLARFGVSKDKVLNRKFGTEKRRRNKKKRQKMQLMRSLIICTPTLHKILIGHDLRDKKLGGACSAHDSNANGI